ncbi:MAG: hypothetical protein ACYDHZ_03425 [Dehalococcoidia bacterium]|jgi:hypothetical protein
MKWQKKGLIYCPDGSSTWAKNSALTPTPYLLNDRIIRIYVSFRDDLGVGRIGYVDVDSDNPSKVLGVSTEPVLDIGVPGAFDDNGVILGDVISLNGQLHMFYVGFQLVSKAKFLAFSGLAVSNDGGGSFRRVHNSPIMDRSDEGIYIRAIHSVLVDNNVVKIWYAAGNSWTWIVGKPFPSYDIRYMETDKSLSLADAGKKCVEPQGEEYRIGRPRVYKIGDGYKMFYTWGNLQGAYMLGYAESADGIQWKRLDDRVGIELSKEGWDSKSICYPALLSCKNKVYMFYDGNDMGKSGFGYAVLETW